MKYLWILSCTFCEVWEFLEDTSLLESEHKIRESGPKGGLAGVTANRPDFGFTFVQKGMIFFLVSNGHQTLIIRKRHVWSTLRYFLEVYCNDWAFIQDTRLNEVGKVRKIRDRKRMFSDEANFTGFG